MPDTKNKRPRSPRRSKQKSATMTNVRHHGGTLIEQMNRLKGLINEGRERSFEIGDLVESITKHHNKTVAQIAGTLDVSRSRLCELRRTAVAFPPTKRTREVDFHFFTMAARCSRRLEMEPGAVLDIIVREKLRSTRQVSSFIRARIRAKENAEAAQTAALLVARDGRVINRCHHAPFQTVIPRLADGSVKLVIADPPYGRPDRATTTAVTRPTCDNDTECQARQVTIDLLRLTQPKLAAGGCLVLFRPGSALDPAWLATAISKHGWACHAAPTWAKNKTKPGNADTPYGIGTERLLILSRAGDTLVNHDGSSRSDVLNHRPVQPSEAGDEHHRYEKPEQLMRFLITKHTYEGELVVEPFGGTGAASRAAAALNRHWVYSESNPENFSSGNNRIATAMGTAHQQAV